MKKKRSPWRWLILVLCMIALAVVLFILLRPADASSQYREETVRTGTLETAYTFSGNIAVHDSQSILAAGGATVRELYVAQGDPVEAGTPLLRLSSGEIVKADIGGEITELYVAEGDSVAMGSPLADVVDLDRLQVLVRVDEFDVSAVEIGKETVITVDALDYTYSGEVEYISRLAYGAQANAATQLTASTPGAVTYYEARLTAPPDDVRVLPGMQVEAKIVAQRVDNAMLLSMSALQFDEYNMPFVYIRDAGGSMVAQYVSVGIQDGITAQITEGLRSGETVYAPQNGTRFIMMGQSGTR